MNKNFADWYRVANIDPNDEMLRKRWEGVEAYINETENITDIFELVKLFFRSYNKNEFRNKFTQVFKNIDSAFPQKSDVEISVLAGAALSAIIGKYSNWDKLAMIAVRTMAFNNNLPIVGDIFEEIINQFNDKSSKIREDIFSTNQSRISTPISKSLVEVLNTAQQTGNWNANGVDISKQLISYIANLEKFLNNLEKCKQEEERTLKILSEDSQILWWMTSGWSNDFNKPFKELKIEEASIVLGKELSEIIQVMPGPYAAMAVLHTVLCNHTNNDNSKEIMLKDAINALDNEWKDRIVKEYDVDIMKELTPVLFAVTKSLEVDNKEEWLPIFRKYMGYSADDKKIKPINLAYQMYLECLLFKCYLELEFEE